MNNLKRRCTIAIILCPLIGPVVLYYKYKLEKSIEIQDKTLAIKYFQYLNVILTSTYYIVLFASIIFTCSIIAE
jgi:hypothetical protein